VSQQALAKHLGVMPSRMVALVDELETKGILDRRRSTKDRRNYALHLTGRGHQVLGELSRVAAEHEESLCAALNTEERAQLSDLCRRIAEQQGLTPGVHPGYSQLRRKR
jgi:DNA-binding MarR family transcriptional regulator